MKKIQSLWFKFIRFICQFLSIIFFRLRVDGQGNIPKNSGAIIASNHQSYLDPVFLIVGLRRATHFLARRELFEANRFFGLLISSLNSIPLERQGFDSKGVRQAVECLKNGGLLLVFPEGTRTFNGEIGPIKTGVRLLARRAGVPIIPALVTGAYQVWSRHTTLPARFHPVRVAYGKPLFLEDKMSSERIEKSIYQAWDGLKVESSALSSLNL